MKRKNESKDDRSSKRRKTDKKEEEEKPRRSSRQAKRKLKEESESEEENISEDSEKSSSSSNDDQDDEDAEVYSDSASEEDDDEEESGSAESDDSEHDSFCKQCKKAGKLLCCDGCTASWHMNCLDPPMKKIPDGKWFCPICKPEKYNMGEIDPMEGCVDKVLWMRVAEKDKKKDDSNSGEVDEEIEIEEDNREFYVKWKDKSYRHCEWISEKRIKKIALQKYKNFLKNNDDSDSEDEQEEEGWHYGVKTEWLEPERVIDVDEKGKKKEYLVKWRDLQYEDCTWEEESALEHFKDKIKKFQQFNDYKSVIKERKKSVKKGKWAKMSKQPAALAGGNLHDYQLEGVNWLRYSWYQDTNVILADEMGLGKTIQSISFLVSLKEENLEGPFLLVVPHSTMKNWVREFEFWAPHLNVILYWGSKDSRDMIRKHEFFFEEEANTKTKTDKTPKFNVLITSYEFILHDNSQLKPYTWQALIVDEAHRLKNNNSKLFQALTAYKTQYRVLLTGTPLQNNLQELYHLLNFLTPSKFPSLDEFEANFNNLNKEEVISQLHALLKPRMLRRMKADVLKQLPPKKELIVGVDLSALQRQYYQAILTKNFKVLNRGMKGTAQVSLLNVLMELKKCANHPYLFPNAEPKTASDEEAIKLMVAASGKFQLLDKMLIKLKETGHRVLIFSQMTKMLDILEDYLHFKKFDYERLDGSIPADVRQERIDRFNMPNSNVFCFLLSTRAGGLGINLATADTVVIFDSDWNPHNDLQALSRCHRIGQDKKVMIYRFVTRSSVEEKILQRSKEKLMLEQLVVRKISSGKAEGSLLSQSELDEILRHGAADIFKTDDKDNKDSLTPSSGGIYYDDDAINKLLDRSQITDADTLENEVNNEYLQGFKVAEFGSSVPKVDKMEVDAGEDAKEKIDERDQDYWDKLLKDRFEEYEAEEEQGKENAKRTRHARHKMQRGLSEEYWEISKKLVGKKKKGDSSSDSESSSSSSEEAEEQDESYEDDGQTLVDDFDLEMQDAVIDIPGMVRRPMTVPPPGMAPHEMMPGSPTKASSNRPPASSMSTFTINPTSHAAPTTLTTASATAIKTAINNKKVSSPALMEGSDKGLKVLGFNAAQRKSFITMLMAFGVGDGSWGHFLSSPAKPKSLAGKSHRDLASYGSLLLMHLLEKPNDTDKFSDSVPKEGIKQSEVLQRIALLFLVRNKVLEILGGKDFDINDGRVTNLFKSWGNAAMPWKKEHDRTLLFGVMKHGYSRWVDIALDEDLKLTKVIHDQLAYEDKVASRNPSASKKEHKEGEQNGTANNNDQSDGKDNSEKEKDSEKGDKDKEKDKEKDKDKPFSDVRTKKFVKRRMGLIEQALIVENQLRELQAQQQQSKSSTSPISVSNMGSIAPQTSAETTPRVSPLTSNVNYASSYTFNNTNFNGAKSSSVVSIQPASAMTSITSASLPSVSTLLNSEKKSLLEIKPSTTPTSISPKPIVPISNLTAPVTSTAAPAGTTTVVPPLDTNMAFIQKFRELYAYVKGPEFMGATDITTLNELVAQTKKYLNEL